MSGITWEQAERLLATVRDIHAVTCLSDMRLARIERALCGNHEPAGAGARGNLPADWSVVIPMRGPVR